MTGRGQSVVRLAAIILGCLLFVSARAQENSAANPTSFERDQPDADAALKAGANSFVESQARALIQKQGYSDVSPLTNDPSGIWHGTARKNDHTVNVGVDFRGNVVAH